MIVSSLLYAAIFGHVTTIIHNMTAATAKYHEMLSSVKEFMMLGWARERLTSLKILFRNVIRCNNWRSLQLQYSTKR